MNVEDKAQFICDVLEKVGFEICEYRIETASEQDDRIIFSMFCDSIKYSSNYSLTIFKLVSIEDEINSMSQFAISKTVKKLISEYRNQCEDKGF